MRMELMVVSWWVLTTTAVIVASRQITIYARRASVSSSVSEEPDSQYHRRESDPDFTVLMGVA